MGGGGVPSGGVTIVKISGQRSLKPTGKPNSRADLYVNGKRKQSRWYDYKGKAIRNRDYFHQDDDHTHTFPHDHPWEWSKTPPRSPNGISPDYENYPEGK